MITAETLSPISIEVLGQLFTNGPTWDGNIVSKQGRDQLIKMGYADRVNGFAFLTGEGVQLASEWDAFQLPVTGNRRWYEKAKLHQ